CHVYLGAAAVADYTPARIREHKIKKNNNGLTLELKRTTDIIKKLGEMKTRQFIVGFSVETESVIAHSVQKMQTKNMDMIVVNNPLEKGAGFATDTNRVTMIERDGGREDLPMLSKLEVADRILEKVARMISVKDGNNRKTL
ncbi:MAG TPA: bifunctional 4'-phosphopantothenoylcysteine decarboxylase/phosphopantothenoylcysteine synthetase, partial [Caldithrix abyssi]|nr:bifunctional 4'-phosphopantothenoylcysteine decarboxylase/phosphopantothenoylcysteine synthetase [Caldithrix abyssi]